MLFGYDELLMKLLAMGFSPPIFDTTPTLTSFYHLIWAVASVSSIIIRDMDN